MDREYCLTLLTHLYFRSPYIKYIEKLLIVASKSRNILHRSAEIAVDSNGSIL